MGKVSSDFLANVWLLFSNNAVVLSPTVKGGRSCTLVATSLYKVYAHC